MAGNYLRRFGAAFGLAGLIGLAAPPLWAQDEPSVTPTLNTLVVTSSSAEEAKREVTSNITVITAKDIKKSTAKDLGQLLNQHGFQTYTTSGNGGSGATLPLHPRHRQLFHEQRIGRGHPDSP